MFSEFFKKELFTGLKRPMVYIFMFIVGLLVFGAVVSDNVQIGGVVGDVKKNAPTVVGRFVGILNVFGMLFAVAFFNNAALRDHKYGFFEILFSTPISKAGYFFGRFIGAWILSCLVMVGIYIGFIIGAAIGPAMHWIGPERMGDTPWLAFFNSFVLFVMPNMLLVGSIIFTLATRFKSTIISFLGALFIILGYSISASLMSDVDNQSLAALVDVFGIRAYAVDIQYYSPFEMNTTTMGFSGNLLKNRLLWTTVALVILFLSYLTFSFSAKAKKVKKKKAGDANQKQSVFQKPTISISADKTPTWKHFASFFKINFLSMAKSATFIIILAFAVIMLVGNIWGGFEYFGLKSYPVTYKMLDEVNGISSLFVLIILVFFSGELVWRDRDSHISEVIDGTPHQSMVSLIAKALSLVVLATTIHMFLVLIAIIYQAVNGYTNFEVGLYLMDFLSGPFIMYLFWATIFVFIQVLVNQKYLAYFLSVLSLFLVDLIIAALKIDSNMVVLGSTPSTRYSDMNGFGPGMEAQLWFSAYWLIFGVVLLIIAGMFWPRGMNKSIKDRFAVGRKSLSTSYYSSLGFFSLTWVAIAGFVYYNTQVLNPYFNSETELEQQVEYEKNYKHFENAPLPSMTDLTFNIDIFPEDRAVKSKVDITITNKTSKPIDSLHFTVLEEDYVSIEIPNSKLVHGEKGTFYYIYQLDQTLAPGDSMQMVCKYDYLPKGFENRVTTTKFVRNGTFFNNGDILPTFGYQKRFEVSDKNRRKKYDLPERDRMPELQATCSHVCMKNYLTEGSADWVNVETFISTSEDQIAIAPGSLVSQSTENGRNKYHYKVDTPSQNFYAFISAKYEVARRKWKGIDLEVYYHKEHEVNVEGMLDAVQKSLEYFTTHFGPYYHNQARIIEFPRYASFAQAFPGTMPYSEALGFIIDLEDETKNNVVDAVIAHEMGHQYWAHQVIGAAMQGSTMLSESFAEYSSLMVMKQESDPVEMKDFIKYDLQRYLRGRSRETEKELPLAKVENQGHIHYGKGSVILYALQDYIGEEKVNNALRGFLEEYRYQEPPYPTSNDFMRYLKQEVPDSLQSLLVDWFDEITFYDLRLEEVTCVKNANGKYDISLDIIAKKTKASEAGEMTDVTIADWVDVGFYKDRDEKELMFRERVYMNQENTKLNFTLDELPAKAAVDPLRILIDRVYKDNRKTVSLE